MKLPSIRSVVAPSGRGSVVIIAALLLGSASIRLVTSAGSVLAEDSPPPQNAAMMADTPTADMDKEAMAAQTAPSSSLAGANRDEISKLIGALTEREAQVTKREQQLEMRLRALAVADAEIQKRLESLVETENALRATLSLADEASEKDILRLTTVYENMKPKEAAILFEEMEPNFAAGFLGRMRPDAAADIMAGLTPQIAYSISVILAGRNATVPKT